MLLLAFAWRGWSEESATPEASLLPEFETSAYWREQVRTFQFDPGVRVHINAPAVERFDPSKPVRVVFFALPNGNTIEQTVGRQMVEGLDWHYDIQHIGAQTRRLREVIPGANLVVVYVEAEGKSWPAWRKNQGYNDALIAQLVESVTAAFDASSTTVELTSHSGGGSFVFGFLNSAPRIPEQVRRIAFLDSNYGYSDEDGHGDKLIEWLRRDSGNRLVVIAYDDREIELDGKKVVGPTGGTYRATHRMLERFRKDLELPEVTEGSLLRYRSEDGQVEFIIHSNPENAILHTVLVEKNGFIHALTFGSPFENAAGAFFGPRAYAEWVQAE